MILLYIMNESRESRSSIVTTMKSSSQVVSKRLLNMGIAIFVVAYFVWTTSCIQRAINVGDELRYEAVDDITQCPPVVISANHRDSISNNIQPRRQMIRQKIKSIVERLEMEWNTTLHITPNTTSVDDDDDGCTRKVLTNLHIPKQLQTLDHSVGQVTLVLATHLSIDKIYDRLPILLQFWAGPISLAIYIKEYNQISSFGDVLQNLSIADQSMFLDGEIVLHFLMEINPSSGYPHNRLRNIAMAYDFGTFDTEYDFVLSTDVDFIPTYGAHRKLTNLLQPHNTFGPDCTSTFVSSSSSSSNNSSPSSTPLLDLLRNKTALILPVFDLTGPGTADSLSYETKVNIIPKTRSEVIQRYVDQSRVRMIKYDNQYIIRRFKCMPCHESTNYPRWLEKKKIRHRGTKTDSRRKRQQSSSSTDSYPIEASLHFEPYFIAHRSSLPLYYEPFRGYGFNKQSFLVETVLTGFTFHTLRDYFLIHLSHASNANKDQQRHNLIIWEEDFAPYLRTKFPNASEYQNMFFDPPWRASKRIKIIL